MRATDHEQLLGVDSPLSRRRQRMAGICAQRPSAATALDKETPAVAVGPDPQPYAPVRVETPGCSVLEDVVFSEDNKTFYVSCMGTQNVLVGDAVADKPRRTVALSDGSNASNASHCVAKRQPGTSINRKFRRRALLDQIRLHGLVRL